MITYGKQSINEKDIESVLDIFKSDFLTTGPKVKEFEEKFAYHVGSKYAVAVSNGTAALHLASLALGLKEGDEVICTPMTFVASSNCVLYCGAKPIFVDIDENGLIDFSKIEEKITSKTKAIILVHYSGNVCNIEEIKKIADKYNLKIIEDSCHALGSKYKENFIGSCSHSNLSCFSFHPVKTITTGEGGMITTNNEELYKKLLLLRTHGITKLDEEFVNKSHGPWYYEMQELGFNYRLTDFQCALGISQLSRLDEFLEKRRKIAERYDESFKENKNVELLKIDKNVFNSYHLYVIKVKDKETRLNIFNYLKENNVFCQVHYIPVHLHPYYKRLGFKEHDFPIAEKFYERIISLPMYADLKEEEQDKVIKLIGDFFGK
jgi:UDP-4-amino-4,6-dideoxy-N-acetyl-beta-L-altrosamine transaminase